MISTVPNPSPSIRSRLGVLVCIMLLTGLPQMARGAQPFDPKNISGNELLDLVQNSGDPRTRMAAATEIGKRKLLQTEDAIALVVERDTDFRVRRAALLALQVMGSELLARELVVTVNFDEHKSNRKLALNLIGRLRVESAAVALVSVLQNDEVVAFRKLAARILARNRWSVADTSLLIVVREDDNVAVRREALKVLEVFRYEGLRTLVRERALVDADADFRRDLVRRLSEKPELDDKDTLIRALDDPACDVGRAAAGGLVKYGESELGALLRRKAMEARDPACAREFGKRAGELGQ